ncbi:hypothetical protein B0T14DRAFT_571226 [Immersiella caudata]|uniref:Uncharacterized protein n=1 Tax=Immersiella caudata TaxID=314043 RepID=A0AA39U5D8_9PEZI|nr:hypothetical protein B0T14DRAFT_571226 [Immersiella caudata]
MSSWTPNPTAAPFDPNTPWTPTPSTPSDSPPIVAKGIPRNTLAGIPVELRLMIYEKYFSATRLAFGVRHIGRRPFMCLQCPFWPVVPLYWFDNIRVHPAQNGLAILRTCRTFRREIGDDWIKQVTFFFEDTVTMLHKLSTFPREKLWLIRYVIVVDEWFQYEWKEGRCRRAKIRRYAPLHTLWLHFPALQLEELCVVSRRIRRSLDETQHGLVESRLSRFIKDGLGWRTLRLIHPHDELLQTFSNDSAPHALSNPNYPIAGAASWLHKWERLLLSRDTPSNAPGDAPCDASVTAYRSLSSEVGSVLDPKLRVRFQPPTPNTIVGLEYRSATDDREVMIVIKRDSRAARIRREPPPWLLTLMPLPVFYQGREHQAQSVYGNPLNIVMSHMPDMCDVYNSDKRGAYDLMPSMGWPWVEMRDVRWFPRFKKSAQFIHQ